MAIDNVPGSWEDGMTKNRDMRGEGLEPAAGNGLINRRALLGRGMMIAGAMGTGLGGSSASAAISSNSWGRRTTRGRPRWTIAATRW